MRTPAAWIALVLALFISPLRADPTYPLLWHAQIAPPRTGLPSITLDAGYPGPYISTGNLPVHLKATAPAAGFDGYLGFHFGKKGASTYDVPVVSRVRLRPGESWELTTEVQPLFYSNNNRELGQPREIVADWRTRELEDLGQVSAGSPPWTSPKCLWVASAGTPVPDGMKILGDSPYIVRAADLKDRAQWYAGFSAVAITTEMWLELPLAVRQAILGSGTYVAFAGPPRKDQAMTALDHALIPVVFQWAPNGEVSWSPSADASSMNRGSVATLVATKRAAFGETITALERTIPAMAISPLAQPSDWSGEIHQPRPNAAELFEQYRIFFFALMLLAGSITTWLLLRRKPSLAIAAIPLLMAGAIVILRQEFRPRVHERSVEVTTPIVPGIQRHFEQTRYVREATFPALTRPADFARTARSGFAGYPTYAEVRDGKTIPGQGLLLGRQRPWNAAERWIVRDELGASPAIHIRERTATRLVFDFENPYAVQYAAASWSVGGRRFRGEGRIPAGRKGVATVEAGRSNWEILGTWLFEGNTDRVQSPRNVSGLWDDDVAIELTSNDRSATRTNRWSLRDGSGRGAAFQIRGTLHREPDATLTCSFVLPGDLHPRNAVLGVVLHRNLPPAAIEVEGPGGRVSLPTKGRMHLIGTHVFEAPAGSLERIAPNGGLVQVTVHPAELTQSPILEVQINVLEKNQ